MWKTSHYANDCYRRNNNNNRRYGRGQQGNYVSSSNNNVEHLFVMQHMMSACAQGSCAEMMYGMWILVRQTI